MFNAILTITKFPLFQCVDNHDSNSNKDLSQCKEIVDSNSVIKKHSFTKDFDYNTIDKSVLGQMKMPYVNCNRGVFADSIKDLVDILQLEESFDVLLFKRIDIFKYNIENVRHSIANIISSTDKFKFELSNEKNYTPDNLLGIDINSEIAKDLNNELIKIQSAIKHPYIVSINRVSILTIFGILDNYIFEDLECNNTLFLSRLKFSDIFPSIFDKEILNFDETVSILNTSICVYAEFSSLVDSINPIIYKLTKLNSSKDVITSIVFICNIIFKWYIEIRIRTTISSIKSLNEIDTSFLKQTIIYSNNTDSILEKLSHAIKLIVDESSEKILDDLNIKKIVIPKKLFTVPNFDSYEISILGKKYLIKKIDVITTFHFPTGISTAYLNIHEKFKSAGYLTFGSLDCKLNSCLFLSVEETMDDFFETDNFEIFESDEIQAL